MRDFIADVCFICGMALWDNVLYYYFTCKMYLIFHMCNSVGYVEIIIVPFMINPNYSLYIYLVYL